MLQLSGFPMGPAILLIYIYLPFLVAVNIGDVFIVKSGTTNGGCDSYSTQLAQFWTDSQKLAQAGAYAYLDAAVGNPVALATLMGYFGISSTTDGTFKATQSNMNEVNAFFQGRATFENDKRPFLFCDSDWLMQYQRTDVAKDDNGQTWPFDDNGNLHPPSIEDIEDYRDELFLADHTANSNVPYWSPDIDEFIFDVPSGGNKYCNDPKNLGGTQTNTVPNTVTLCMRNIINNKPTRDSALGNSAATVNRFVKTLVPQAATLFHEAFHVVLGTPETPDAAYLITTIQKVIKTKGALALVPATTNIEDPDAPDAQPNLNSLTQKDLIARNPETYTFFATAYWQYQNNDKKVTLATGQVKALSS